MKNSFSKFGGLAAALLAGVCQSFGLDGIVVANDSVPAASLTPAAIKDIFTGKTMYWEGGQTITIVFVADKTDAALKEVSGMDTGGFKTFWQRLAFSGRGQQPKKVDDAAAAIAAVATSKGAVAIVPADAELKGVKKIEIK